MFNFASIATFALTPFVGAVLPALGVVYGAIGTCWAYKSLESKKLAKENQKLFNMLNNEKDMTSDKYKDIELIAKEINELSQKDVPISLTLNKIKELRLVEEKHNKLKLK